MFIAIYIYRHQRRQEEVFRDVRPRQLESEQQIHALVSDWNEKQKRRTELAGYDEIVIFLKSVQNALFFAAGRNPDEDLFEDSDEDEIE